MADQGEANAAAGLAHALVARAFAEAAVAAVAAHVPGASATMAELLDTSVVTIQGMPKIAPWITVAQTLAVNDIEKTQTKLRPSHKGASPKPAREPPP